jgi:hypothetical protein
MSTDCDSQAPGLSSGFEKENAANIVASAVTATPVIATTVTLDDDPLIGFIATRLSVIELDSRFAIANRMAGGPPTPPRSLQPSG